MANAKYKELEFAKGWPSVTTICGMKDKPWLARWRGKYGNEEADRIMKSSQSIGLLFETYVDHWFEDEDATRSDKLEEKVFDCPESKEYYYQAVKNWHVFAKEMKPVSVLKQYIVYNKTDKYVGTFDRLFKVGDKLILGDWKVTNDVHDEYFLQIEAYYRAAVDMKLEWTKDVKDFWICQFPKKEDIDLVKHIHKFTPDDARYEKGFRTLLQHWWWESDCKRATKPVKSSKAK